MTPVEQILGPRNQLLPRERDIFIRFYAKYGSEFSDWEFAHRFGPPALPTEGLPESLQYWVDVTARLRADVIARRGTRWYIFEIKPTAKPAAIGQLRAYISYWNEEFPGRPLPTPAIICEFVPDYMHAVAAREGVELFVV
jgi:hypothetical protein